MVLLLGVQELVGDLGGDLGRLGGLRSEEGERIGIMFIIVTKLLFVFWLLVCTHELDLNVQPEPPKTITTPSPPTNPPIPLTTNPKTTVNNLLKTTPIHSNNNQPSPECPEPDPLPQ